MNSINEEDKINFPLEVFSREVDFVPLADGNSIATGRGVALKVENDPNAYWFVDLHPNKVCVLIIVAAHDREHYVINTMIQRHYVIT